MKRGGRAYFSNANNAAASRLSSGAQHAKQALLNERNYKSQDNSIELQITDQAIGQAKSRDSSPRDDEVATIALIVCYELYQRAMIAKSEREQIKSKDSFQSNSLSFSAYTV